MRRAGIVVALGEAFDEVLVAAQAGAGWAFARLYDDLAGIVAGYLRLRGAAEPDDVTSETFLAVFRGLGSFTGGEQQFRSWVFTIAHRRLLDEHRYRSRRPATTELDRATRPPKSALSASEGRSSEQPDEVEEGRRTAEDNREEAVENAEEAADNADEGRTEADDNSSGEAVPDDVPADPEQHQDAGQDTADSSTSEEAPSGGEAAPETGDDARR